METISISKLKSHLSAELKKVRKGTKIVVLDHRHPVAQLVPIEGKDGIFTREATSPYICRDLEPLVDIDVAEDMEKERTDRW